MIMLLVGVIHQASNISVVNMICRFTLWGLFLHADIMEILCLYVEGVVTDEVCDNM